MYKTINNKNNLSHFLCVPSSIESLIRAHRGWGTLLLTYMLYIAYQKNWLRGQKWSELKVAQSCLTLCDSKDYTVFGILQDRILEWVAYPFSRGSFQPRGWTQVSCLAGRFFTSWATRKTGLWYSDDTFYLIFSTLQDFKSFRMTSFWNSFELKYLKFYLDYFKVPPSVHL